MKKQTAHRHRGATEQRWTEVFASMENLNGDPNFEAFLDAFHLLRDEYVTDCKSKECLGSHPELAFNLGGVEVCDRVISHFANT
jgi:hypothetical protein